MATLTNPKGSKLLSDWRHSLNPTSTKESEVETLWSFKILPAVQKSAFQCLKQQFPRLQRE
ncbi:hypothetical protein BGZ93_010815 [Podila epicladia]|nr:hypothetical protein BGZ92_011871 [Podila epicladia]KAG0087648.1 hypothetical protein BGZ93_010815 [Podila epicladia]